MSNTQIPPGSSLRDARLVGTTIFPADARVQIGDAGPGIIATRGYVGGQIENNLGIASAVLSPSNEVNLGTASSVTSIKIGNGGSTTSVTINGNLAVNGSTTTVSSTNTVYSDTLLGLQAGATVGANASGLIINRGDGTNTATNKNAFIGFNEFDDKFKIGFTSTKIGENVTDVADFVKGTLVADLNGTADAATTVVDGAITAAKLAANAVETVKINALAVTEAKIGALAVTEGKIGALAVTEGKIGALAVTESKIGALAVTAGKLADAAVETLKIKDAAVETAKINALAVTEAKIGALAVTEGKINALAVTEAKIGALAVTEGKIGALAVTEAKIGALAVTADKLAALAVTTGKLADAAVTAAKIAIDAVDLTSTTVKGALPITKGGTGATSKSGARDALELGSANSPTFAGLTVGGSSLSFTTLTAGAPLVMGNYIVGAVGLTLILPFPTTIGTLVIIYSPIYGYTLNYAAHNGQTGSNEGIAAGNVVVSIAVSSTEWVSYRGGVAINWQ